MSLFGDLFDDESSATGTYETSSKACGNKSKDEAPDCEAPVSSRLSHGFSGIFNQGATCYLNALIQTLVMTPEFRESLFTLGQNELGDLQDKDKPQARVRVIPIHLQRLIARLRLLDVQAVKTADLTDSFGWTNSEEREQHDVQELNRILFCAVEDSLIGTSGEKLIRNLYHGTIVNQIKCEECGNTSDREEDFLDLCVTVAGCSDLEDSLKRSFVEVELLNNTNKYHCAKCSKLTNAVKRTRLRHLPPVLTISLLRFNFDFTKMERFKEVGSFAFPTKVNMAKYCENAGGSDISTDYELFSVVIHRGSTHGGHYHAYIRDIDNIGNWIHPDEEEICLMPSSQGSSPLDVIECSSCQSLLRTILQRSDKKSGMTVDALCAELMKQTGVSWNKRFKKQYGPITKFLKKYNDQFVYNSDTNWVSLKEGSCPAEIVIGEGDCSVQNKNKKSNRSQSPVPEPGDCWFDFDDVHIHPIRLKDLEKQFSGKESAYMLFYRNRSLVRPPEALHNPRFGIPEQIIDDILKENAELKQLRCQHQTRMNNVKIEVHFGSSYFYSNGSLQPRDGVCTFMELEIDRRKLVSDLLSTLTTTVDFDLIEENRVIHTANETPSGLHLYQNITADLEASLVSYGIGNSSKVFIWDGHQIGGNVVVTGRDCEPVLLNVICSNGIQFNSGFAKNLTVRDLKEAISLRSGIPVRHLQLNLLVDTDSSGGSSDHVSDLFAEEDKTLAMLKVENCNNLYVMDVSANAEQPYVSEVKSIQAKCQMTFTVENRCLESPSDSNWQAVCVKVDKGSTVEELKAVALSQMKCQELDPTSTRLRVDDNGLAVKPPLYDHQTIDAAGLTEGLQLLLESGKSPKPNEVVVLISVVKSSKVTTSLELLVEKNMKLGRLLELAIDGASLESSNWHLCRMDWNGDSMEILDDIDMSLDGYHINHGAQLALEFGQLPPKGFLQISIYLFPSEFSNSRQQPGFIQQLSIKLQEWLTFKNNEEEASDESKLTLFKPLGTVVISKLATLLDLKEQIMTLDGMSNFCIPTAKFLRVRILRSKQLGQVLRLHLQTLQKLKLVNGCELGVQVLSDEEDLSVNQLLLTACLRSEDERKYLAQHELIWDTSQGATLTLLRRAVANLYQLPEQNLLMAKHIEEKYEWIILTEQSSNTDQKTSKTQGKGKKKGKNRADLRQAPYYLKDGDVIGVKNLRDGSSTAADDFGTAEDDDGKERLRKEADDIRKKREEKRRQSIDFDGGSGSVKLKGRPELAIKIHVDNFS